MSDQFGPVTDIARDVLRGIVDGEGARQYQAGFTAAARISLDLIGEALGEYKGQMTGAGLSKAEQATYARLDDLKSNIEKAFDEYWQGTGINWRPPEPVARAVRGRMGHLPPGD